MVGKRVISSATSDLISDQRLHRTAMYLEESKVKVVLIGREKKSSPNLGKRDYKTFRLNPWFQKGPLFYFEFNLRLFFKLLFIKADGFLANDLDTLPANAMAGTIRRIPVIYDIHEYFTEVPELIHRNRTRKIWQILERAFFRVPKKHFTVSQSIAIALQEKYNVKVELVRNLPYYINTGSTEIDINGVNTILYQGSVNVSRGLEEMIEAMEFLPNFNFLIVGDGDILTDLKHKVEQCDYKERIEFKGRVPFSQLPAITKSAHLGISIEKKDGKSYEYALPNKFFDYIQSGLPTLISDLPEMKRINEKYKVAVVAPNHDPQTIANTIKDLFNDLALYKQLKSNCGVSAKELNWENESKKLDSIFGLISDPGESD